jgi:methionyl-tRNA synthetase
MGSSTWGRWRAPCYRRMSTLGSARARAGNVVPLRHRRTRHHHELAAAERASIRRPSASRRTRCSTSWAAIRLSWDHFGRSSSPQNRRLTQHFGQQLWEAGFLQERVTQQVYSRTRQALPARPIRDRTCPHCGYEAARGDQCENCTRVLDPHDLIHRGLRCPARPTSRSAAPSTCSCARACSPTSCGLDRGQARRLAAAGHLDRAQVAGRGAAGPRHHPRPAMGRAGQRLEWGPNPDGQLPDVEGLAARCSTSGSTRRSSTSARPGSGPTPRRRKAGAADDAEWERWWRLPRPATSPT